MAILKVQPNGKVCFVEGIHEYEDCMTCACDLFQDQAKLSDAERKCIDDFFYFVFFEVKDWILYTLFVFLAVWHLFTFVGEKFLGPGFRTLDEFLFQSLFLVTCFLLLGGRFNWQFYDKLHGSSIQSLLDFGEQHMKAAHVWVMQRVPL